MVQARHGNDASLSSDSVFALLVSRRGSVWIGTEAGVDRLDPATGEIQRVDLGRGAQRVRSLLEDQPGHDLGWRGRWASRA